VVHEENRHLPDLSMREKFVLWPLAVMALVMGVASPWFMRPMEPSTERVMREAGSAVQRVERDPATRDRQGAGASLGYPLAHARGSSERQRPR